MNIFHQLGGRLGDVILPLTTGQHHHHQAMPGVNRVDASGQQRLVELFWQDRFLPGLATAASGSPRPDKKLPMLHTPAAALAGNGFSLLGSSNPGVNSTCSSSTIGEAAKQAMSKVGNQTNSQDPQAVNSRVFVGNLNTFQVTKTEIEKMFQPYGRIAGISMHKGYAFVQFTNQSDARSACTGEDGKSISGQVLDVNMVAEPKPHQVGRKRQNVTKTGNDWEHYYDSYCAPVTVVASSTPSKRPRLVTSPSPQRTPSSSNGDTVTLDQLKTYSSPDILICGNCREMFSDLAGMIDHKRSYCKLRFTCRCAHQSPSTARTSESEDIGENQFVCGRCKEDMKSAADLMMHAQTVHATGICQQDAKLHMNGPASSGSQRSPSTFSQASETSDAFNHTTNHPELMMISNDPLPMTEDELTILSESCIAEPV